MFVFVSCQEQQLWEEVEVGKTIKIESKQFISNNLNYIYKWSKPIATNNENLDIEYLIENDKMLITPSTVGQYKIYLTVDNLSNEKVHEEVINLNVIKSNSINITDLNNQTKKDNNSKNNSISDNKKYTIQVASWPSIEQAIKDKEFLIESGYDAYIEKYENLKKTVVRWRVRIGNFEDKKLALQAKSELSNFRGKDIWIDQIK